MPEPLKVSDKLKKSVEAAKKVQESIKKLSTKK